MTLPKVHFQQRHLNQIEGVEILDLNNLYSKAFQDHDPACPHRVEFHCLIYIEEGEGFHFVDFEQFPVMAGTCITINRHQVHAYDFKHKPQGKLLLFTEAFLESVRINIRTSVYAPFYLSSEYSPAFNLNTHTQNSCIAILNEIEKEQNAPAPDLLIIELLFSALIQKIENEKQLTYPSKTSDKRKKTFIQFLDLIEAHYRNTRDANDYADMMHITYKTLNQLCKTVSHQTAKQLIDAQVILQAKRELVIEHKQTQELAFELGFDDLSNFIKYFKKRTSMTPTQFRESH